MSPNATLQHALAGDGVITVLASVELTGPIDPGQAFALIWFDAGVAPGSIVAPLTKYGFLQSASFIIPPDGHTTPFVSAPEFLGTVERRAGDDGRVFSIPEASAALLGLASLLGLTRRRRR